MSAAFRQLLGPSSPARRSTQNQSSRRRCGAKAGKSRLKATPPSYRPDSRFRDLAEEVRATDGLGRHSTVLPRAAGATPPGFPAASRSCHSRSFTRFRDNGNQDPRVHNLEEQSDFPGLTKSGRSVVIRYLRLSELRQSPRLPACSAVSSFNLNREAEGLQASRSAACSADRRSQYRERPYQRCFNMGRSDSKESAVRYQADYFTLKGALEAYFRALQLDEAIDPGRAGRRPYRTR